MDFVSGQVMSIPIAYSGTGEMNTRILQPIGPL